MNKKINFLKIIFIVIISRLISSTTFLLFILFCKLLKVINK